MFCIDVQLMYAVSTIPEDPKRFAEAHGLLDKKNLDTHIFPICFNVQAKFGEGHPFVLAQ